MVAGSVNGFNQTAFIVIDIAADLAFLVCDLGGQVIGVVFGGDEFGVPRLDLTYHSRTINLPRLDLTYC